jgi:hypothetical protein
LARLATVDSSPSCSRGQNYHSRSWDAAPRLEKLWLDCSQIQPCCTHRLAASQGPGGALSSPMTPFSSPMQYQLQLRMILPHPARLKSVTMHLHDAKASNPSRILLVRCSRRRKERAFRCSAAYLNIGQGASQFLTKLFRPVRS